MRVASVHGACVAPALPSCGEGDRQANLEVDLLSVVRLDRALGPHLTAQGHGAVVHVSSNAARQLQPNGVPYAATNTANLSRSPAPRTACVTAVLPGVIETDAVEAALRQAAVLGERAEDRGGVDDH